jgi:tRNA A37 N6-isopentenylltransferase MiaA
LAKRQLTWLRSEDGAHWLGDAASPLDSGLSLVREVLHEGGG